MHGRDERSIFKKRGAAIRSETRSAFADSVWDWRVRKGNIQVTHGLPVRMERKFLSDLEAILRLD